MSQLNADSLVEAGFDEAGRGCLRAVAPNADFGRMDPGESPVDAALREAFEEVALDPASVTVHGELDHLSLLRPWWSATVS